MCVCVCLCVCLCVCVFVCVCVCVCVCVIVFGFMLSCALMNIVTFATQQVLIQAVKGESNINLNFEESGHRAYAAMLKVCSEYIIIVILHLLCIRTYNAMVVYYNIACVIAFRYVYLTALWVFSP